LLHFQQKLARDKSFYGSAQKSESGEDVVLDVDVAKTKDATEGRDVLNVMTTGGTRLAGDCRLSSYSDRSASGRGLGSSSGSGFLSLAWGIRHSRRRQPVKNQSAAPWS